MKIFTGKVMLRKMQKTVTVVVERFVTHPIYKKRVKKIKKYHVHDEIGVKVGDKVEFVATKPFSKMVKWNVLKVVDKENKVGKKTKKKITSKSKKGKK